MQHGADGELEKLEQGFWETVRQRVGKYARHYSDAEFWKKSAKFAKKTGKGVLKPAFTLFHAAQDAATPKWAQATMVGALGYFISLVDAIPDITPVVGYADDLWVLAVATVVVASHIKPEHSAKAEESLSRWFGEDS